MSLKGRALRRSVTLPCSLRLHERRLGYQTPRYRGAVLADVASGAGQRAPSDRLAQLAADALEIPEGNPLPSPSQARVLAAERHRKYLEDASGLCRYGLVPTPSARRPRSPRQWLSTWYRWLPARAATGPARASARIPLEGSAEEALRQAWESRSGRRPVMSALHVKVSYRTGR